MEKKKNYTVLAVSLLIIVGLFVVIVLKDRKENVKDSETKTTFLSEEEQIRSEEVFTIETKYCNLCYPEKWKENLQIGIDENDVYTVNFSADGIELFDLSFNGEDGYALGTLKTEEGNFVVRVVSYDIDDSIENYETYLMMQDDINIIIEHMVSDYEFIVGEIVEDGNDSVYGIETSVTTFYYPEKWKDIVTIDKTEDSVQFSYNDIKLFDLNFSGTDGYLLGKYKDIEIRVVSYEINEDNISVTELTELRAMQEDVNVIIQKLFLDNNFKANE